MRYGAIVLLLVTILEGKPPADAATAGNPPSIAIALPPDVASETVQISYQLRGRFGGSAGYLKQQAGLRSYQIPAEVEGKAADEIRAIVYAPGCEIQTFAIPLTPGSETQPQFECRQVKTARLTGRIIPQELVRGGNAELVVTYMAYWAHGFYGISDGAVISFEVARVLPDATGAFTVDLPRLFDDPRASPEHQAGFRLFLRDAMTWNSIAWSLEPELRHLELQQGSLRIQSHYPDRLQFTPAR